MVKNSKRKILALCLCLMSVLSGVAQTEKRIDYVNPFVGTDGYGNVYPGAQIPFGGIQISPDTDNRFYDAASGYKYNRPTLMGFSLTHLSGTGIPDLGDFLFIPDQSIMKCDKIRGAGSLSSKFCRASFTALMLPSVYLP